jgi:hypothetical protein
VPVDMSHLLIEQSRSRGSPFRINTTVYSPNKLSNVYVYIRVYIYIMYILCVYMYIMDILCIYIYIMYIFIMYIFIMNIYILCIYILCIYILCIYKHNNIWNIYIYILLIYVAQDHWPPFLQQQKLTLTLDPNMYCNH